MAAELGSAFISIIPKAPNIKNNITNLLGPAAESGGSTAGGKAGSALLSKLKGVVTVAAVGKIMKDAFSAGGDLEQSFGGLETIYGNAAEGAKQYAVQAASAGISANSYAEQAVSFGAALKQAFAGDTAKAMEAANTAIMDMADNSAKMGTDIGSIQTAYQGFAKQNYTMLDNLKLGYGGTKTEMQRLLADAQKLSGVKYDINNLGDVYDAIHVIQQDLGLTGVAAAEAETTLTGSFGAMKASWTNLLAAMTTGEGLDEAMQNLGKSAGNLLKNVVRMLGNVARQLPQLLSGLFAAIGPELLPAATGIIQGLLTGITTQLPQLLTGGSEMLLTIVQGIVEAVPQLLQAGLQIIPEILTGIVAALPQLLSTGSQILSTLLNGIITNLPQLLSGGAQAIGQFILGVIEHLPEILAAGIQLLGELATGVINAIPTLIMAVPEMFSQLGSALKDVDWASLGRAIIDGIVNGVKSAAGKLVQAAKDAVKNALKGAKSEAEVGSPSRLFADEVGRWIPAGMAVGIEEGQPVLNRQIRSMISDSVTDLSRLVRAEPDRSAGGRSAASGGNIIVNQNIQTVPQTPVQLAAATTAFLEQARWSMA